MIKFKTMKKQKLEERNNMLKGQFKTFNIDSLNQRYDSIINKYKDFKIVNSATKDLANELGILQNEVNQRLIALQSQIRALDQKYNKSIIDKSDFDIDYYKQIKEDAFKLDSLSRTINERLSAMNESIGMGIRR